MRTIQESTAERVERLAHYLSLWPENSSGPACLRRIAETRKVRVSDVKNLQRVVAFLKERRVAVRKLENPTAGIDRMVELTQHLLNGSEDVA